MPTGLHDLLVFFIYNFSNVQRTMLFWQFNSELVQNFTGVALQCAEKCAVSIHDDEPKAIVVRKQIWQNS
jgi:hypothetical protein